MWGICLDIEAWEDGLFQAVISYERINERQVQVRLPKAGYQLDIQKIRELPDSPNFLYGDSVVPCNHPEMVGEILEIRWHFQCNRPFYHIQINGKRKSKRYFDEDLRRCTYSHCDECEISK